MCRCNFVCDQQRLTNHVSRRVLGPRARFACHFTLLIRVFFFFFFFFLFELHLTIRIGHYCCFYRVVAELSRCIIRVTIVKWHKIIELVMIIMFCIYSFLVLRRITFMFSVLFVIFYRFHIFIILLSCYRAEVYVFCNVFNVY